MKGAIEAHLSETEIHVERLEEIFQSLGKKPVAKKCEALEGILKEADEVTSEVEDRETLDAAIISSAQTVEHYEIARYGTLACWARLLGMEKAENLLQNTLDEERDADHKLSSLAEGSINQRAAA